MPNHFHAIIEIVGATLVVAQNENTIAQNQNIVAQNEIKTNDNEYGQPQGIAPTKSPTEPPTKTPTERQINNPPNATTNKTIGDIIGAFKSITTVEYIRGVKSNKWQSFNGKLWQRNYWEHIIRDEQSYNRISEYIINNPKNWVDDKFYE